jgi:HAMP domain-containing protein
MATNIDTQKPKDIKRSNVYFSLRWKLLVGFTLIFSVVFAIAFYWFYTFASTQALTRIQQDLLDTLQGASQEVDGDTLLALSKDGKPNAAGETWLTVANAEEEETADAATLREAAESNFGQATPAGFSDDPRYQQLMDELQAIHNIEPRAWPYLFVRGEGEREITYIADLWARYDPTKATPFLFTRSSRRSYNGLSELTLRTDDQGNFTPYTDQFGRWVSAYMPVKNAQGETVGAVGVDFAADYVYEVQDAIRDQVATAFAVTYLALFLLVFIFSGALTGPIVKLTHAANALGEGDYNQDFSKLKSAGRFSDEIVKLADVFAVMADKVRQREQTLRRQVEALKIEIDETKRKKQVSEIADSDFFRELQNKARDMRSQHGDE